MGVAATPRVEVQLEGAWTDITADVLDAGGLSGRYGITGAGPHDVVAGTGELSFILKNHAGNSGGVQGYYSPTHAACRTGWAFGVPVRVHFASPIHPTLSVVSLTRTGDVVTVTVSAPVNWQAGQWIRLAGASPAAYNGAHRLTTAVSTTVFTFTLAGTPSTPATGTITAQRVCPRFTGRVHVIDPTPGQYGRQQVRVVAYDLMRDLAAADLRTVPVQVGKTETELVEAVLAAVPAHAQPATQALSSGVDVFPYAFDDLSSGTKALTVLARVARGAFATIYAAGDGTFTLQSRHGRASGTSLLTFDNSMRGLTVPSSLEQVYRVVRVTVRPRTIDAVPTAVLYAQQGAAPAVAPGDTVTIWASYSDPNDRTAAIGGLNIQDPVVNLFFNDYAANSSADGSGTDLTGALVVVVDAFASTAKIAVTNTGSTTAYLTALQLRGRGVYDHGPQTVEVTNDAQPYGAAEVALDLEYQASQAVARDAALFVSAQYGTLASQPTAVLLQASVSDTMMQAALEVEIGDRLTLSEMVTGLNDVEVVVQSVQWTYQGGWLEVQFGLAPAAPWRAWILGLAGSSELGETTVLGF